MKEEDRKTFKLTFKDQRRIINKEITLLDLVVEKQEEIEKLRDEVKYYKDDRDKVEERLREEQFKKGYCKFKEECGEYADCLRETYLNEIDRVKKEHEAIKKYVHNHTITYMDNGIECCKPDEYFNISCVEDMLDGNFENLEVLFEESDKE